MSLRLSRIGPWLLVTVLWAANARGQAQTPEGVALGVGVGAAVPSGEVFDNHAKTPLSPNFGWGFYVNIPLLYTFELMPHAELYNVAPNVTATDIGLAFKFVVAVPFVRPYFGVSVGDTNILSSQQFNVGGLVGAKIHVIGNIDAFVEGRYVVVVRDSAVGGNIRTVHVLGGALFQF